MNRIHLLPLGAIPVGMLTDLGQGIERELGVACNFLPPEPEPSFAYSLVRNQYHSTEILASVARHRDPGAWRVLSITSCDLFIPILTFVFGEAQMGDACSLVSYHRLRQEFYGLPQDESLLRSRLLKEAIHELGHTFSLSHCNDYRCVMSPSHGVEWIDLKEHRFCGACRGLLQGWRNASAGSSL